MEVLTIAKLDHQLNEEIRDKEIRLIGADGAQLGIMSSAQANAGRRTGHGLSEDLSQRDPSRL